MKFKISTVYQAEFCIFVINKITQYSLLIILIKRMTQQLGFFDKISEELIKSKHLNYSEDNMNFYIDYKRTVVEDIQGIYNKYGEQLKCTLIRHRKNKQTHKLQQNTKCVIYLHGFNSTRLQALSLMQHLPKPYCLCIFDLSGSGKSEGEIITYGMKEQFDIQPVIQFLHEKRDIEGFILWGRSMGAVATLIYAINKKSINKQNKRSRVHSVKNSRHSMIKNEKLSPQSLIWAIVLDSPFNDFKQISREMAANKFFIPTFLIDIALRHLQQYFNKILSKSIGVTYNPFNIRFDKQINLDIPIICVYSENDDIINPSHCLKIISKIVSKYQKVVIKDCKHNDIRPKESFDEIFRLLQKFHRYDALFSQKLQNSCLFLQNYNYNRSTEKKRGIFVYTPSKQIKKQADSPQKLQKAVKVFEINSIKTEQLYDRKQKSLPKSSQLTKKGIMTVSQLKGSSKKMKLISLSSENCLNLYNKYDQSHPYINKKLQECKLNENFNAKIKNKINNKSKFIKDPKEIKHTKIIGQK